MPAAFSASSLNESSTRFENRRSSLLSPIQNCPTLWIAFGVATRTCSRSIAENADVAKWQTQTDLESVAARLANYFPLADVRTLVNTKGHHRRSEGQHCVNRLIPRAPRASRVWEEFQLREYFGTAARTSRRFKRERSKLRCDIAICERFATMVVSFK